MNDPAPRRRLRYSLRTLLLFVLLVGSAYGLWARWEPWRPLRKLAIDNSLRLSREGRCYATETSRNYVELRSPITDETIGFIKNLKAPIQHAGELLLIPRAKKALVSYNFHRLGSRIFKIHTLYPNLLDAQSGHEKPNSVASCKCFGASADGSQILMSRARGGLTSLSASTGQPIFHFSTKVEGEERGPNVVCAQFSQDAEHVLAILQNGEYVIIDTKTKRGLNRLRMGLANCICGAFSPRGERVFVGGDGLEAWDLVEQRRLWRQSSDALIYYLKVSIDGDFIIVRDNTGNSKLLDANTGASLSIPTFKGKLTGLAFLYLKGSLVLMTHESLTDNLSRPDTMLFFVLRRPPHWWGVAWLPEFWLTVVLGVGLVWSVWRDWTRLARL